MLLHGQELLGQRKEGHDLSTERLIGDETLTVQVDLGDEVVVRATHRNGPKEGFQIVGKVATSSVALTGGVKGNENTGIEVDVHVPAQQLHRARSARCHDKIRQAKRVKVSDTVSFTAKGARDVDFESSRACASLFQRSPRPLTLILLVFSLMASWIT